MSYKEEFINIYEENIKREGAEKLLDWLKTTDFFTAPASTRFHLSLEGGLVEHSVNVYKRLKKLIGDENLQEKYSDECIAVCGLLHDICKVGFYKVEMRNSKNEEGNWVKVPYYMVEDTLPYGHGEKSVYMISGFMRLEREEAFAVRWHMGGFDESVKGGSFALNKAFELYPLAVYTHIADMLASNIDEKGK